MKKLSQITESLWADVQNQASGNTIKQEDMTLTCLGVYIHLEDKNCNYDGVIKDMINDYIREDYCNMFINNIQNVRYSLDELKNIRKWEAPYAFMIYEGGHGTDLIMSFTSYDDLMEIEDDICDCVSENDYKAICKGIAEKFKEFGENLQYIHTNPNHFWIIEGDGKISDYHQIYVFELIDEGSTTYWAAEEENDGRDYTHDFIEDICDTFDSIQYEDFIGWSYNNYGGISIGIPINFDNLINVKEYIDYAKKWFAV